MDNTMIEGRLKAIEESLSSIRRFSIQLTSTDILVSLRVLFISLPLLVKYLTTPLLEK